MSSKKNNKIEDSHRGYGYIRVSTRYQSDGASLLNQTRAIQKCSLDNDVELIDILQDEGSGLNDDRDGFIDLLATIQPGDWLFVYELSRLSRKQTTVLNTVRDLVDNKGITFICLNPSIDSRNESCALMLGLYSTIFQEESNRTSQRVSACMKSLSEQGKLVCRPPFGYFQDDQRRYIEEPEQQEVLTDIKIWYLSGLNPSKIAARLNLEGRGGTLNNNKKKKVENSKFTPCNVAMLLRSNHILVDSKTPPFSNKQRVDNWNATAHKPKNKTPLEETPLP